MITVIAGVNGAGKSSIFGSMIRSQGDDYFNPDEVTREIMKADPSLSLKDANSQAWVKGRDMLKRAIVDDEDYTFESTLGGTTICGLLHDALDQGRAVRILFCGLESPELHIQRVAERVAKGGHDIPETRIRDRWSNAIHNMMKLIPRCQAVRVYDNSAPITGGKTGAICLFALVDGKLQQQPVSPIPEWAAALASVAIKRSLEV